MSGSLKKSVIDFFQRALCRHQWLADILQYNPAVRSYFNTLLINIEIGKAPPRPYPLSTRSDYTSWDSLTDRTFSGRHLPPLSQSEVTRLPEIGKVKALFERPQSGMRPCKKSTVLFSYFAQWFTDAFLRTTRQANGHYDANLRNTSPHDVDLSNLYGMRWNVFGQPKDDVRYLRSMDGGKLKSQWINGEEYAPYYYDASEQAKEEFKSLSMTDSLLLFSKLMRRTEPLDTQMFAMGGDRLNAQVGFAAMNTLFLREHNRICDLLRSKYPQWDDERLFQTARNINIGVLAKVVIEEYINHISPLLFRFRLEPGRFERQNWYRLNWMTIEFNLLYRWHSLVPDHYLMRGIAGTSTSPLEIPLQTTIFNNSLLTDRGLGAVLEDASRQAAGEIGLFNTTQALLGFEEAAIQLGRLARLPGYNAYRQLIGRDPARGFDQISPDPRVCDHLKDLYGTVDQVEFYTGIFAESVVANSALAPLSGALVAIDAFSQALTNPLLSARLFNKETFTEVGLEVIASTARLSDVLHRNLPGKNDKYYLSMTQQPAKLFDQIPVAGGPVANTPTAGIAGAVGGIA